MKLHEITGEFQNIFEQIGEDGELSSELLELMDSVQNNFEQKAIAVASYIKNLQAEEEAIANAVAEMNKRKSSLTKKAESLTDYLQFNLQTLSISEIKSSPYFKIRLKKCPPSVEVFDETAIPAEFMREKLTVTVDKIKIKDVLSEGVEVPGATLQRKVKLEIK